MPPLVSVIIPTYNRTPMLLRALKSVLAQSHARLEIIVVDDGSTDDPEPMIRSLNDPRILYLRQSQNRGAAAARNLGMRHAQGEQLMFLDSDDEFLPGRIGRLLEVFGSLADRPGLIFTNAFEINVKGEKTFTVDPAHPSGYVTTDRRFPASVFTPTSCWMICRDAAQGEFFDEQIYTIEDCDLFARIARKSPSYFLNEALTLKHVHSDAQGRVPLAHAEQTRERMLSKWLPEMKKDRDFLVSFYCTMAKDLVRCGKKKKAIDILWKALSVAPFNVKIVGKLFKAYA